MFRKTIFDIEHSSEVERFNNLLEISLGLVWLIQIGDTFALNIV